MSAGFPLQLDDELREPVPHTEERLLKVRYCESSRMDITLCYQCFGDPASCNPVVLLVGGLNMQLYAWDEAFCEDLVRAGFFVIRYDNRDIGYSTKVEKCGSVVGPRLLLPGPWATALGERLPYTMDDMAKDGLALLTALKIPLAHVLGVSMGGSIAQCMALLAPEVVMSLTSIMSTTNAPELPEPQLWVKLWMLRQPPKNCTVDKLLDFRVSSLRRLLEHALPVDDAYLKKRYLMSLNRSSYGAGLLRQAAAMRRCPGRDVALRKLTIPALVVHGAQDLVVPPCHGYRTADVIPHARLLVLKSMGHYFHPAFFPSIIAAFADMARTTAGPGVPLESSAILRPFTAAATPSRIRPGAGSAAAAASLAAGASGGALAPPLMASLGVMLRPVVATPASIVGAAAVRMINVSVPSSGDPVLPEAVLLDLHGNGRADWRRTTAVAATATSGASAADTTTAVVEKSEKSAVAVPYVAGSPSIWQCATRPSPIVASGQYSQQPLPCSTGRVVPVIAGTPLETVLARGTGAEAETMGGRRSRPPSLMHSRHASQDSAIEGIGPAPPLPAGYAVGSDADAIDPCSRANAEDVATTLLPPLLPGTLDALAETVVDRDCANELAAPP